MIEILEDPQPESLVLRKQTILIVDDDVAVADVLCRRLEQQGFETMTVATGSEALVAAQRQPSLVLLDLRLPDIDGWTVCEKLADASETCHIPVIMLSAMERPDIIRRSRAAGCQYFVRKPYDPNALLILIRHALQEATAWQFPPPG
jgi:CheY-like chemotaxis protein